MLALDIAWNRIPKVKGANRPRRSRSLGSTTSHQEQRWLNPSPWRSGGGREVLLAVTPFLLSWMMPSPMLDAVCLGRDTQVLLWTLGMFLQCDFDWTYMNLYIYIIYIQLFMYTLMNVHKHFSKKNRFCSFLKVPSSSLISLRLATTAGFSSAAVLRGKGCAFGVRRPEASQAAHAASSTAKSRSAWHICCLLSLEMQAPSFHKSKKLTSSLQIKMPYHIIGIYWNEWLDIHEVLWWLPYFAQKEK